MAMDNSQGFSVTRRPNNTTVIIIQGDNTSQQTAPQTETSNQTFQLPANTPHDSVNLDLNYTLTGMRLADDNQDGMLSRQEAASAAHQLLGRSDATPKEIELGRIFAGLVEGGQNGQGLMPDLNGDGKATEQDLQSLANYDGQGDTISSDDFMKAFGNQAKAGGNLIDMDRLQQIANGQDSTNNNTATDNSGSSNTNNSNNTGNTSSTSSQLSQIVSQIANIIKSLVSSLANNQNSTATQQVAANAPSSYTGTTQSKDDDSTSSNTNNSQESANSSDSSALAGIMSSMVSILSKFVQVLQQFIPSITQNQQQQ